MWQTVSKHRFLVCCLVKTLQILVFLASLLWELEVNKWRKHWYWPYISSNLLTNIAKHIVFCAFAFEDAVFWDHFRPWCCKNIVKYSFSSKGTKMPLSTEFLDIFGLFTWPGATRRRRRRRTTTTTNIMCFCIVALPVLVTLVRADPAAERHEYAFQMG